MTQVVCMISGGLDSCVTAALACAEGFELAFLHVDYGQRTSKRERQAFNNIADHYQVRNRLTANAKYFKKIGGSALTDTSIPVPPGDLNRHNIPSSYVPFRNANLLSIATSWAELLGAVRIYIGVVEEDSSGYPDCRHSFFKAFNNVIREGTRPETSLQIVTPLIRLNKTDIVKKGTALQAPLHLTWSCYTEEELACGKCDSCLLRIRGFQNAGIPDPITYQES